MKWSANRPPLRFLLRNSLPHGARCPFFARLSRYYTLAAFEKEDDFPRQTAIMLVICKYSGKIPPAAARTGPEVAVRMQAAARSGGLADVGQMQVAARSGGLADVVQMQAAARSGGRTNFRRQGGAAMQAETRRNKILKELQNTSEPVSASRLAALFGVSRQIIVGDVALLRALGADIIATPRGYILSAQKEGILRRVPCRHSADEMRKELQIMVDNGCLVKDVIVEHPVYGQLAGELNISTRHEVDEFMVLVRRKDAAPLSDLTGGIHLHTVLFPDEEAYQRVLAGLREAGFLYEN